MPEPCAVPAIAAELLDQEHQVIEVYEATDQFVVGGEIRKRMVRVEFEPIEFEAEYCVELIASQHGLILPERVSKRGGARPNAGRPPKGEST